MHGGWLEGSAAVAVRALCGRSAYSVLVAVVVARLSDSPRIAIKMLSDFQSVSRVMNPRAGKGVAVETLFVTPRGE